MSAPAAPVRAEASGPRGGGRPVRRTLLLGLVGLFAALLLVSLLSVFVGARLVRLDVAVEVLRDLRPASADHEVVLNRLPRLLAGLLVGMALGPAGSIMQGVMRNPLADPGLLGINAGAALAVTCAISLLGITAATGLVWFAFLGATVVAVLVYAIGSLGREGATPVKLALAGAAVSAALTSVTTAVLLTDAATFDQYRFWTVGSLTGRRWDQVAPIAPFTVAGVALALCTGRLLNTLSLGEDVARGLGQRVWLARVTASIAAVVLCGAATAIAGPIWFVGLLVPHLARLVASPDYRWILPYSMVLAPTLLLASDVVGRVVTPSGEIQVGVVLSFVGAPFLILLVRRRRLAGL